MLTLSTRAPTNMQLSTRRSTGSHRSPSLPPEEEREEVLRIQEIARINGIKANVELLIRKKRLKILLQEVDDVLLMSTSRHISIREVQARNKIYGTIYQNTQRQVIKTQSEKCNDTNQKWVRTKKQGGGRN